MGKQWTDAEELKLREMYDADVPYKKMAKTLKRTAGACQNRAFIMGLTGKKSKQTTPKAPPTQQLSLKPNLEPTLILRATPAPRVPWWKRLFGIGE